jgi:release factor glutamine methyltransferase
MHCKGSFLDLGTGTGFVALANAKLNKENRVLGIDINPVAVRNAELNAKMNNIRNAEFIVSDMFSKVKGRFDTIAFNPPYLGKDETKTRDDLNFIDQGQITEFFRSYARFLNPNGRAYVILSSQNARFQGYMETAKRLNGFGIVEKERYFFEELALASFMA